MNEYLQLKENGLNLLNRIIIFSNKPKNSYSIPLCGKKRLQITKYEISPKYLTNNLTNNY